MTRRPLAAISGVVCAVLGAVAWTWIAPASAQTAGTDPPFGARASFRLNKATLRAQGAQPDLLEKVDASSYRYFRLLATQFAQRTCFELRDLRWRLPSVAIHGDAHVEQFVVTDDAYGLADFDRSGFGPAVVDLVRYATSLHLVCRDAQWPCDASQAVGAYFEAYRTALDHPVTRRQPAVVDRVRADVRQDAQTWLHWAEGLMEPMLADEEQGLRDGWWRFVALMKDTSPERPESFYRIVRIGALHLGIGSALEPKTLIRIAGPTDKAEDDLILEARITPTPDGRECVSRAPNGGSLQVLMFTALLAQRLPEVFGFLPREIPRPAPELWIQSWDRGYRELSLAELRSQTDLNELARDAGSQLAGHFWTTFPEPLRRHQRFAQLRAFELSADRARDLARAFADDVVTEWNRFRRQR